MFGYAIVGFVITVIVAVIVQPYLPTPAPKIVGIDLGTSFSSIAVYHQGTGEIEVIQNEWNQSTIPSVVSFLNNQILVGVKAREQLILHPRNTIYDSKRIIGLNFDEVKENHDNFPFEIIEREGKPFYSIEGKEYSPEQVGSEILKELMRIFQRRFGSPIQRAVISVPVEFDEERRAATQRAAEMAGLDVFRIINEPTAAALAYGVQEKKEVDLILVFDFGGGTLDVSLLGKESNMFITIAIAGNNRLGGEDFTNLLQEHFIQKFTENKVDIDKLTPNEVLSIRKTVEETKILLSDETEVTGNFSVNNEIFKFKITRDDLETICQELFNKMLEPIRAVLEESTFKIEQIDEIILVGGTTRMPGVRSRIKDFFFGKEPNYSIDPDVAVARGVAFQAAILADLGRITTAAIELPSKVKKIRLE